MAFCVVAVRVRRRAGEPREPLQPCSEPCGECHLWPGETCNTCDATARSSRQRVPQRRTHAARVHSLWGEDRRSTGSVRPPAECRGMVPFRRVGPGRTHYSRYAPETARDERKPRRTGVPAARPREPGDHAAEWRRQRRTPCAHPRRKGRDCGHDLCGHDDRQAWRDPSHRYNRPKSTVAASIGVLMRYSPATWSR